MTKGGSKSGGGGAPKPGGTKGGTSKPGGTKGGPDWGNTTIRNPKVGGHETRIDKK